MRTYRKTDRTAKADAPRHSPLYDKRIMIPIIALLSAAIVALAVLLALDSSGLLYGASEQKPSDVIGSAAPPIDGALISDGVFQYVLLTDGTAELAYYGGVGAGAVTVPSELGGYKITSIGNDCFWLSGVTSVVIPEGVTSIDKGAFEKCYYLETLTLPSSLVTVATDAFSECFSLQTVVFSGERGSLAVGSGNDRLLRLISEQ